MIKKVYVFWVFWKYFGSILEVFWKYFEVFEGFWNYFEDILMFLLWSIGILYNDKLISTPILIVSFLRVLMSSSLPLSIVSILNCLPLFLSASFPFYLSSYLPLCIVSLLPLFLSSCLLRFHFTFVSHFYRFFINWANIRKMI